MDAYVNSFLLHVIELLVIIPVFFAMSRIVNYIINKIKASNYIMNSRFLNPSEYLPDEEIATMRQVFYLIMIILFIIESLYSIFIQFNGDRTFVVLDLILSFYLAYQMDKHSYKSKFLLLFVIPFSSIYYLMFDYNWYFYIIDIIHAIVFIYFIKVYYQKFLDYTQTNSLGITIMLLFMIILISFLFTIPVEGVSPLDSLVMVSNAFTSNGYAVLGKSSLGKINSIFLVWSGFILSGVGTATLAVSIVMRHVNEKFDRLEELAKKNKKD